MNDYSRNIAFTSTTTEYELLTDTNVKSAIKLRLGITSDTEHATLITNGIRYEIFRGDTTSNFTSLTSISTMNIALL